LRFDLFALRDELRAAVIAGEAPQNKWFEYLDTTITKSIDNIQHLNIWEIGGLVLNHGHDESLVQAYLRLLDALAEPGNERLAQIYGRLVGLNATFLAGRHRVTVATVLGLAGMATRTAKVIDRCRKRIELVLSGAPETSTLLRYC
jgi:hypothetical protein